MTPRRPWCTHSSSTGLNTVTVCFMGCRLYICVQNVLNSAARVVLKTSKFQHITAAVRDQFHWLPVKQRVEFKQALFVYKPTRSSVRQLHRIPCRHVSARVNSSTRRHLRSAAHGNLVELRCRTTRYEKRSFPASAPLTWNSLPMAVRDVSISMNSFRLSVDV